MSTPECRKGHPLTPLAAHMYRALSMPRMKSPPELHQTLSLRIPLDQVIHGYATT